MSKWEDRVAGHAATTALQAIGSLLEQLVVDAGMNPNAVEDLERIRATHGYVSSIVSTSDPQLVNFAALNHLAGPLQNVLNEISAFKSDRNIAHLANANAHVDALLPHLIQLAPLGPSEAVEGLRDSVVSFRRSVGQYLASVEREKDSLLSETNELKARLAEMTNEVSQQKGRLDSAITEYQQQFSQAESLRRDEFNRLHSEFIAESKAAQEAQQASFAGSLTEAKDKYSVLAESQKDAFSKLTEQHQENAKAEIVALQGFRDQAQELLQIIGSTGMAGEFQKAATSAKKTVWLWQGVAVASMLGLIGFAILAYQATSDGGINWPFIGTRLFVAVAFGVLAAFSVRQGDRYHQVELRNRRYQLELSSIEPYLAGLQAEQRDEVKVRLAERLFGGADIAQSASRQTSGGTSLDLVRISLETLQEAIKRGS